MSTRVTGFIGRIRYHDSRPFEIVGILGQRQGIDVRPQSDVRSRSAGVENTDYASFHKRFIGNADLVELLFDERAGPDLATACFSKPMYRSSATNHIITLCRRFVSDLYVIHHADHSSCHARTLLPKKLWRYRPQRISHSRQTVTSFRNEEPSKPVVQGSELPQIYRAGMERTKKETKSFPAGKAKAPAARLWEKF